MNVYLNNCNDYFDAEMQVVPLNGKIPFIKDWLNTDFDGLSSKDGNSFQNKNIGLKTGEKSGIICIDIDATDPHIQKNIYTQLPPLLCGKTGNKKKGINYFFKYNGEESRAFKGIDILSDGKQTVLPPSMHDNGYQYDWEGIELIGADLPYLPETFIPWCEKEFGKGDRTITYEKEDGRCVHGSHNKLSEILVACIHEGQTPNEIVEKLLGFDNEINKDISFFNCKTERWKRKNRELNAYDFVLKGMDRHIKIGAISEVPKPSPLIELSNITKPTKNFKKLPRLEGIGDLLFQDIYNKSPVPRSQFTFMSVMNLISVCIGNQAFLKGTAGNLYQYGVSPSGYGKDFPFKATKQLLHSINLSKSIGGTSPTSETVVLSQLESNRIRCFFINEAESLLKRVTNDRTNFGLRESLTDIFDYVGKTMEPKELVTNNKNNKLVGDVFSPYLNIIMTSTIEAFEKHAGLDIFNTGFGSRFLFYFEDRPKKERMMDDYIYRPSKSVTEAITALSGVDLNRVIELDMKTPFDLYYLKIAPNGKKVYKEIFHEIAKNKQNIDGQFHGIVSRQLLYNHKFALLHHCSINPNCFKHTEITSKSFEWAHEAISAITHNMMQNLDETVSDSDYGRQIKKMIKYIKFRTIKGDKTTLKMIDQRFNSIPKRLRRDMLADTLSQELIGKTKENTLYYI